MSRQRGEDDASDVNLQRRVKALQESLNTSQPKAPNGSLEKTFGSPYWKLPLRLKWRIWTHQPRKLLRSLNWRALFWWILRRSVRVTVLTGALALLLYELREWHDDRLTRNWQLLATQTPGNSGKITALEYLHSKAFCTPLGFRIPLIGKCWKERARLSGIDLSSHTNNGSVYLANLKLPNAMLARANLSGAHLFQANLSRTNLVRADLSDANLITADLSRSKLQFANLERADLGGAFLSRANFFGANLKDTNLRSADLSGATIILANVSNTKFTNVILNKNTKFKFVWAEEDNPPVDMPYSVLMSIPFRKEKEPWPQFVDRVIRERPSLGWEPMHKNVFND